MAELNDVPPPPKKARKAAGKPVVKDSTLNRKLAEARKKRAALKRQLEYHEKKLEALKGEESLITKGGVVDETTIESAEPETQQELDHREVAFRPNPGPQTDFLAASEREVLYGGAAGGGKSYAMIMDHLRYVPHPEHRAILFRRTNDELRELVYKTKETYPRVFPGAKFSEQKSTWIFPSGATMWMTYLDRDDDVLRYQGQAFNWIGFDELTQWPSPFPWEYMRSRLRTTAKDLPLCMRACVDEGDVLTTTGWKPIQEVSVGEKVYSLTSEGQLVVRRVHKAVSYDVSEPLVRIRKKNLYMSMTADHRVVHQKYGRSDFAITRWNEITNRSVSIARAATEYDAIGYRSPIGTFSDVSYAKFLGLYIAEGCVTTRNRVILTQLKAENHDFVGDTLREGGYEAKYYANGDFVIHDAALHAHLAPLGKAHQKHFPKSFLALATTEQLLAAFNAYALGDGHWQSEKSCTLVTCSKQLADDLQEIAVKLGWKSQVHHTKFDNPNWNDRYTVYVSLRGVTTKVDKYDEGRSDVSYEDYTGKVYCLGVEGTENFFLRQKGFVWCSGNTTNPGNVGAWWVRAMFIDAAPWGEAFWAKDIETGQVLTFPKNYPDPDKAGKPLFKRRFIPARLQDNPYLFEAGDYETNLMAMPESQRRMLLEGDWDVVDGAAFPEFRRQVHVCEPFEIPDNWTKFRACDWGYSAPAAVLWFAVDYDDNLYIYREYYRKGVNAEDFSQIILDMEEGERVRYGVLDSSVWHKRGEMGPTPAETMNKFGLRFRPADRSKGSRVAGRQEIHRRLKVDPDTGEPRLKIFANCTNLIRTLPVLPVDKNNPEDVDTDAEDHLYDALRYGCQSRPTNRDMFNSFQRQLLKPTRKQPFDSVFGY